MTTKIKFRGKEKTAAQWVALHDRMSNPPACENQHYGCSCSSTPGGPCYDEMVGITLLNGDAP